jgi:hypothetical protein
MLAHAVRKVGCYTSVELSLLVNDVNVPVAHRLFARDGLPSRRELVLSLPKEDKLTSGLAETRRQELRRDGLPSRSELVLSLPKEDKLTSGLTGNRNQKLKRGAQNPPFLISGSPGRTRTADQVVTSALAFLPGLDYLITRPK